MAAAATASKGQPQPPEISYFKTKLAIGAAAIGLVVFAALALLASSHQMPAHAAYNIPPVVAVPMGIVGIFVLGVLAGIAWMNYRNRPQTPSAAVPAAHAQASRSQPQPLEASYFKTKMAIEAAAIGLVVFAALALLASSHQMPAHAAYNIPPVVAVPMGIVGIFVLGVLAGIAWMNYRNRPQTPPAAAPAASSVPSTAPANKPKPPPPRAKRPAPPPPKKAAPPHSSPAAGSGGSALHPSGPAVGAASRDEATHTDVVTGGRKGRRNKEH